MTLRPGPDQGIRLYNLRLIGFRWDGSLEGWIPAKKYLIISFKKQPEIYTKVAADLRLFLHRHKSPYDTSVLANPRRGQLLFSKASQKPLRRTFVEPLQANPVTRFHVNGLAKSFLFHLIPNLFSLETLLLTHTHKKANPRLQIASLGQFCEV